MIRKLRYNVMLNPRTVRELDRLCAARSVSRSRLLDQLLAEYVRTAEGSDPEEEPEELEGQEVIAEW